MDSFFHNTFCVINLLIARWVLFGSTRIWNGYKDIVILVLRIEYSSTIHTKSIISLM